MCKFNRLVALALGWALVAGMESSYAGFTLFSGIDVNGDPNVRVAHPNSDAAHTQFLSNLTGTGTETFESIAANTVPGFLTFPGAGLATFTGNPLVQSVPSGTNGAGRYPISGNQFLEADTASFGISFTKPVAAFGFYGVDIGDFGGTLTLKLANGGSTTLTVPAAPLNVADGSVLYFGFLTTLASDTFTGISFNNSTIDDVFAFDDMTIGSLQQVTPAAVPEPATLTLIGIGVLGMAGYRWRRRTQAAVRG